LILASNNFTNREDIDSLSDMMAGPDDDAEVLRRKLETLYNVLSITPEAVEKFNDSELRYVLEPSYQ
jgi:hypothetical protein